MFQQQDELNLLCKSHMHHEHAWAFDKQVDTRFEASSALLP